MGPSPEPRKLFLRDQRLSVLSGIDDPRQRRVFVCGGHADEAPEDARKEQGAHQDPWQPCPRDQLCAQAAGPTPSQRVALVCSAGLGKTTNMAWLAAQIGQQPGSRQVPFLLRLEDKKDYQVLLHERQLGEPANALVQRLIQKVRDAHQGTHAVRSYTVAPYLVSIGRYQAGGRITVLIDGLDHALSHATLATDLKEMPGSEQWRHCPVWIAGRPEAFRACWDEVFAAPEWKFLRVEPLASPR